MFRNELTVRYAQMNTPLKIPIYPSSSDYYSLEISWAFQRFAYFRPVLLEEAKGIYTCDRLSKNYACIKFHLYCANDVNVNF